MIKTRKFFLLIHVILSIFFAFAVFFDDSLKVFSLSERLFVLPYSYVVYVFTRFLGGHYLSGALFGVLFSYFIVNPSLVKAEFQSEQLKSKVEEIKKVRLGHLKDENGEVIKPIDYLEKNKLNPFAPFAVVLLLPFMIWRIRGITGLNYIMFFARSEINTSFFWFDIRHYDPYMILAFIVLGTFYFSRLVGFFKRSMVPNNEESKVDVEKNDSAEEKEVKNKMKFLMTGLSFFVFSLVILNPVFSFYIIFNFILNFVFYKKVKEAYGGEFEGIISKTGL